MCAQRKAQACQSENEVGGYKIRGGALIGRATPQYGQITSTVFVCLFISANSELQLIDYTPSQTKKNSFH